MSSPPIPPTRTNPRRKADFTPRSGDGGATPHHSSASIPPPAVPRAGATSRAPTHRPDHPQISTTAEAAFTTVPPGRRVTRYGRAIDAAATIVAASTPALSPSTFSPLDEESTTPADGSRADENKLTLEPVTDDATVCEDGASQPLLTDNSPIDVVTIHPTATITEDPIAAMPHEQNCAASTTIADVTMPTGPTPTLTPPNPPAIVHRPQPLPLTSSWIASLPSSCATKARSSTMSLGLTNN